MTIDELQGYAALPLLQLVEKAHAVHVAHWPGNEVQICTLLSIKTGGCPENCAYCAQSAHHSTGLARKDLIPKEEIIERALLAKQTGATRFCMGAAWRGIGSEDPRWTQLLDIVRSVAALGLEVCASLGSIGRDEARQLRSAGLNAYNHNLDTSPEHYPNIVTSHSYQDRLDTIRHVQEAGLSLCCGGIIGMKESGYDRLRLLEIVSSLSPQPESFPINALITIPGTPLQKSKGVTNPCEYIRMCALARIAMPRTRVRMSAGRDRLSKEAQALCFYAGANSLFYGTSYLTAPNLGYGKDFAMLEELGLRPLAPHEINHHFPEEEPHPCFTPGPCKQELS